MSNQETAHRLAALAIERRGVRERLSRCNDLFGQLLLMGRLKSLHREADEIAAQGMSARTAKTPKAVEGEARQPGSEGMRPKGVP